MSGAIFPGSSLPEHNQQTRTKDSKAQHGRTQHESKFIYILQQNPESWTPGEMGTQTEWCEKL